MAVRRAARLLSNPVRMAKAVKRRARRAARPAIVRLFHQEWYDSRVWQRTSWMGTTIRKSPFDLMVLQEIFHEVQPDVVLETGTFGGGSALYYAHLLDLLGIDGRVVTVDVEKEGEPPPHPKIEYLLGSSVEPAILEAMSAHAARGERVLVLLDSDHSRDHVLAEMRAYGPLVTAGSYMVVEDGHANGHPVEPEHGPGPTEAIEMFLAESSDFEVDRAREKFLMTWNPAGYLRRR